MAYLGESCESDVFRDFFKSAVTHKSSLLITHDNVNLHSFLLHSCLCTFPGLFFIENKILLWVNDVSRCSASHVGSRGAGSSFAFYLFFFFLYNLKLWLVVSIWEKPRLQCPSRAFSRNCMLMAASRIWWRTQSGSVWGEGHGLLWMGRR